MDFKYDVIVFRGTLFSWGFDISYSPTKGRISRFLGSVKGF